MPIGGWGMRSAVIHGLVRENQATQDFVGHGKDFAFSLGEMEYSGLFYTVIANNKLVKEYMMQMQNKG